MPQSRRFATNLVYLLTAVCMWIGPGLARAQSVANYAVTRTTGITYSSINSTGTPCNNWRYTGTFQQDDNRSYPVDIGFDFWYDGTRYTQVNISTNGYIDFSSATDDGGPTGGPYGYVNGQFSSVAGTLNAVAPIYDDQTTQGAVNPLGNSIRTQLSGTAPNRILTVEWFNMAVYQNTTPSLNYQVKLHETTGVIDFVYGTMNAGTANFSYTCGLNGPVMSGTPTAAQLKVQQTANTTNFTNTQQNNLSTMPATNSRLVFTPPVPANPGSSLSFTNVLSSQMTLNWTNWATNEVGYVIYSSSDNVNFEFEAQTAANATSATITGLSSSTTYYWRVYAVTEGCLSNAVTGTQATAAGQEFRSFQTGNWGTNSTWERWNGSTWVAANATPASGDNVTITSTHTVTINVNTAACHNLTIGQGGACVLQIGTNNTARVLTVNGNVQVNANATFRASTGSNTTHTLNLYGNLVNNGTFDMQPDANSFCDVSFLHVYTTQTVSGTGATYRFNRITVNKSAGITKLVQVTSAAFTAASGFLTLTSGTFKLSTTGAVNITPFSANASINADSRLWINSSTATVTASASIDLGGELRIDAGTLNVGTAANQGISSSGGLLTINGGALNVAGRYDRASTTSLSRLSISNGTFTLNTVGSTSTANAPFMMDIPGSQFTQTGGTIIIRREGGTGAQDLGFICTGGNIYTVTGGVLQIGDASTPVSQIMQINTVAPVGSLRVASANATARLVTNPVVVINDVLLQAGTFNANNLNVTLGRHWTNSGGTYTAGTNTTTFNGTAAQTITRTAGQESFNHLVFSNAGLKTAASDFNCQNLTINSGATLDAGSPGYGIFVRGSWTNGGTFNPGTAGIVTLNGTTAQVIGGTAATTFRHLTLNNSAGASISADENILGGLTLTLGTFTTTGFNFTLISNASGTAHIAPITGGNITGDIIMQRYQAGGPAGWHQYGCSVTGLTLNTGWNDDFTTAGFPGSDYPNMNGWYSIGLYTESVAGVKEMGYSPPASINDPLSNTKGYFLYDFPLSFEVKGPPVKFTHNLPVTYTPSAGPTQDGWNMLPNPYPCAIDWDAASGWTRTNIDGVLYVWNSSMQQYTTYVGGVGTNGGTRYVASSQAFWVRAVAASPVVTLTEPVKASANPSFLHSQQNINNLLSLTLHRNSFSDQAIVRFDPSGSNLFDIGYDAMKLGSMDTTMPYLASVMDTANELSINTLASLTADVTVPLRTRGATGNYTITRDSISDFPPSVCIILEDLLNGSTTPLVPGSSYSFYLVDTTRAPRFLLHFSPALETGQLTASCPSSSDGKAFAKGIGNGPWNYTWKDGSGNTIAVHNAVTGTDTLSGILPGIYIVEVSGNGGYCDQRTDTLTVNGPQPVTAASVLVQPTCTYTNDGAILLSSIGGGSPPYQLSWPDGSTADSLVNLAPGTYDLQVTDANGCLDTVSFVLNSLSTLSASFVSNVDSVNTQTMVVFSNYSSGAGNYYWDFGDTSGLSTNPNPFYSWNYPGDYTVTLIATDNNCQDTATIVITVLSNLAGVSPVQFSDGVSVLPAENGLALLFELPVNEDVRVHVYDMGGKNLVDIKTNIGSGRLEIPLNAAAGIYTVMIERPEKTVVKKVLLQGR